MSTTMRENFTTGQIYRYAFITAGVIFFLYWLGPFATKEELSASARALYWTVAVTGNMLTAFAIVPLCCRKALQRGVFIWPYIFLGSAASALPGTSNIFLLEYFFRSQLVPILDLIFLYIDVLIITCAVSAVFFLAKQYQTDLNQPHSSGTKAPLPKTAPENEDFIHKLTGGAKLLRLNSQDHYLQVFTDSGTRTMLMRLSDASQHLSLSHGMQVHRSHWVAHSAVKHVEKGKNNVFLHLVDCSKIPVSRKYLKQVCNADWFK